METLFEYEQRALGENDELLHDQSLVQLRQYSYSAVDRSFVSRYVLNPYWTWCAEFMPSWLAPNCITMIGISAILFSNLLILILQNGDLKTPMWRIVYLVFAVSLFFYQTMDNIDGKQARKTGTSSPLGELTDHGIDSLNCLWGTLLLMSAFGQGSSIAGVMTMLPAMIGMYFSAWETYYTKTLFLDYINAPTEGLLLAVGIQLTCVIMGPQFWLEPKFWTFGFPAGIAMAVPMVLTLLVFHIPGCVLNVRRKSKETFYKVQLKMLWPILAITVAVAVWTTCKHSVILQHDHLFLFAWILSFIFGRVTTTIILSHLCGQSYPKLSLPVVVLFIGSFFYGVLPRIGLGFLAVGELIFLRCFLVFAALYFFLFSKLVIDRLTQFLGINFATIASV